MVEALGIYAIFDKKSEKYDTPYFAYSDLFAKRRFMLMLDEEKSPLAKWPGDFQLEKVGEFDIDTGMVTNESKLLIEAQSVVKSKEGE